MVTEGLLWRREEVRGGPWIIPHRAGESLTDDLEVSIPAEVRGPLTLSAVWRYRSVSQHALDQIDERWALPDAARTAPITDLVSATAKIRVEGDPAP